MQTASYIDLGTRDAVLTQSITYLATELEPGVRLAEHLRMHRAATTRPNRRPARLIARLAARYADDRVGDYETTAGGW